MVLSGQNISGILGVVPEESTDDLSRREGIELRPHFRGVFYGGSRRQDLAGRKRYTAGCPDITTRGLQSMPTCALLPFRGIITPYETPCLLLEFVKAQCGRMEESGQHELLTTTVSKYNAIAVRTAVSITDSLRLAPQG